MYKIVSTRINDLNKEYASLRLNSKRDRKKMNDIIVRIDELKSLLKINPETDYAFEFLHAYDELFTSIAYCHCGILENYIKIYELISKVKLEGMKNEAEMRT